MIDAIKRQDEEFTRTTTYAAIVLVLVLAVACVLLLFGAAGNLGRSEANAAPVVSDAPGSMMSPEEHRAFISRGHDRAAREGDPSPLPATF